MPTAPRRPRPPTSASAFARPRGKLRVGFTFNVKRITPTLAGDRDEEAEYDSPKTLQAIREALAAHGHEVIDLEADRTLPARLAAAGVDVVFNIAEGARGASREAQVPALLELLEIPYTGSDPAALVLAHDKALAKRTVRHHGVLTPDFAVLRTGREPLPPALRRFPLLVKPVAEGTSKGVTARSVVRSERALRALALELIARYRQPAIVERFVSGREFTVGVLGDPAPLVLPPMEIVFLDRRDPAPVYSFDMKQDWTDRIRYDVPARLRAGERAALERAARAAFAALGCRDVARIDFRMDEDGQLHFIECNPLPGLTPGWSDLVLIAQGAGIEYPALIGEILGCAIRRRAERAAPPVARRRRGGGRGR